MNKTFKRLLATVLAVIMIATLTVTSFAAKTTDTKTKSTSEFGTLTGSQWYVGKILGRKEVTFETTITKLSSTSINTTLYAQVDIHDYKTGKYLDHDQAMVATNKLETSYYWSGHSSAANDNLISSFGAHEARRSGSAVVYTNIYGL